MRLDRQPISPAGTNPPTRWIRRTALPYLDVVSRVRDASGVPTFAYQVSGEYAMLKAAAGNGWLDEKKAVLESLLCIRRAGASAILSYFALDAARWLAEADTMGGA